MKGILRLYQEPATDSPSSQLLQLLWLLVLQTAALVLNEHRHCGAIFEVEQPNMDVHVCLMI